MLKMLYIRPDAGLKAQECNMRVSIQPLRLNVDQVRVYFLKLPRSISFYLVLGGFA